MLSWLALFEDGSEEGRGRCYFQVAGWCRQQKKPHGECPIDTRFSLFYSFICPSYCFTWSALGLATWFSRHSTRFASQVAREDEPLSWSGGTARFSILALSWQS